MLLVGHCFALSDDMAIDDKEVLAGAEARTKVCELLQGFSVAFMVTVEGGSAAARPLGIVGDTTTFSGALWFITDTRSRKVRAITAGAPTSLIFENHERGTYLYLTGHATVVHDRARLEQLYTPVQRTWFPDGLDDPHITLVRFDAEHADYWDRHGGWLRLSLAFLKAIVTGTAGASGNAGIAELN